MILELLTFIALKGGLYAYQSYHGSSSQEATDEQPAGENAKTCIEALEEAVQEVKEEAFPEDNAVSPLEKEASPCSTVDEELLDAVVERIRLEIPNLLRVY